MCHTVTQCDTTAQKVKKCRKKLKIRQLGNWTYVTYRDTMQEPLNPFWFRGSCTMWHCGISVTLNVIQTIRPSNDGWRHSRSTYLSCCQRPRMTYLTPSPTLQNSEKSQMTHNMNDINWHEWHETTWILMNDTNWHKCYKLTWIWLTDMNLDKMKKNDMKWQKMTRKCLE
jgi:hypothetical protein